MQQQPVETAQGKFNASLYDRFAATIFTYLLSQVQNEQDAQDLLLEVFLAALGNELLSSLPDPTANDALYRMDHVPHSNNIIVVGTMYYSTGETGIVLYITNSVARNQAKR